MRKNPSGDGVRIEKNSRKYSARPPCPRHSPANGCEIIAEADLEIFHFVDGAWEAAEKLSQDLLANTITVRVDSFSPFVLGSIPEPSAASLAIIAAVAPLGRRQRTSRGY
ncbi:MAG: hypothetical protein AAGB00_06925 [Planctomycetota bacterium]